MRQQQRIHQWAQFFVLMGSITFVGCEVTDAESTEEEARLDPEIQAKLDALIECGVDADDCSAELQALLEHSDELQDYIDDLDADTELSFRASSIAQCNPGSVSCSGFFCYATDDVGCTCTNKLGVVVDAKQCEVGGGPICGNGVCDASENYSSCPQDCPCVPQVCGSDDCGWLADGCGKEVWCGHCCAHGHCGVPGDCCETNSDCPGGFCYVQ